MVMAQHWSEHFAGLYLRSRGLAILARDYHCRYGEIDLIALDRSSTSSTVIFIEIKYRRNCLFGRPKESVTVSKQRRITATAKHYLQSTGALEREVRFDVLAISHSHYLPTITWIKDAFYETSQS